ncbi:MAG: hypothetical protein ABI068_14305 [Ktedonobacterales bacterium]
MVTTVSALSMAPTVIASGSIEPSWLHVMGEIAGTLLLIELGFVLLIVALLMAGLAVAAWWVHRHVIPVIGRYTPQAQHYMGIAERSGDRIVGGLAEFHGRRQQVETALRVLFFGPAESRRVRREDELMVAEGYDRGELAPIGQNALDGFAPGELPVEPARRVAPATAPLRPPRTHPIQPLQASQGDQSDESGVGSGLL